MKIRDNIDRCPWCGKIVAWWSFKTRCEFCGRYYIGRVNNFGPYSRDIHTPMPTKGYKAEISLFPKQSKYQLWNDAVVPIIFINDSGTAVSSACCVRIESGKWVNGVLKCDMKLLELGETPQKETDKFYLYNKGSLIAYGKVISELPVSY